ncbi:MAG: hypothetical protein ACTSX6_11580 [Candidatus Heimdallarchaeaceae archaeon]
MDTEVEIKEESSISELLKKYTLRPTQQNAMKLGKAIATTDSSIEVKKWRFQMALNVLTPDKSVYSTIQAWSTIPILQDNIPASMKIVTVKEMLQNTNLKTEVLDEILQNIFVNKEIPRDLLNYIAPEIKRASRISDELKSYVLKKDKS